MAELALSPALQVVSDRLSSPLLQKLGAMWNLKDNLQKLQSALPTLQAILEDEQQMGNGDVRIWSSVVKDVAGCAEDLIDELSISGGFGEQRSGVELDVLDTQYAEGVKEMIVELQRTTDEMLRLNFMVGGGGGGGFLLNL